MGLFDKFPFSNMHQLNLDWILGVCKKAEESCNNLDEKAHIAETSATSARESAESARLSAESAKRSADAFTIDKSLTISGASADAKITGDILNTKEVKGLISAVYVCETDNDINNAIETEWGKMSDNSIRNILLKITGNNLALPCCNCFITINQTAYNCGTVTGYCCTEYGVCVFTENKYDVWSPIEWLNPPMILGVKYRTAEKFNGLPVYAKLVDCGTLPNNDDMSIDIDANIKINVIVSHELYICYLGDRFPYYTKENHSKVSTEIVYDPVPSADGGIISEFYINICTTDNMSGWNGVALVKWTEEVL